MDDRSANALKRVDPFAATDALLSGGFAGESLFVINLCAANMPQAIDAASVRAWGIAGLDSYKLYQVVCKEDGRTRYRVRLGFFTSETDAEVVLRSIRGKFATAFTSGLSDEDLKHASGHLKKPLHEIQEIQDIQRTGRYPVPKFAPEDLPPDDTAPVQRHSQPKPTKPAAPAAPASIARAASAMLDAPKPSAPPVAQKPVKAREEVVEIEWAPANPPAPQSKGKSNPAPSAVKKAPPPAQTMLPARSMALKALNGAKAAAQKPVASPAAPANLQLAAPTPAKPAAPATNKGNQPYHVSGGRSIPDNGLSLSADSAPKAAPTPAAGALPRPLVSPEALSKLRAASQQPRNAPAVIPTLDTTQTIRTLTKSEIEDANAPKWFVVQLAISDQPANLDTMPRLDIFEAYRLYSVAAMQNGTIRHALRLGFFSEKVSAEAVMGYIKTFFGEPTIEQISDAEQKRFGESFVLRDMPAQPARAQETILSSEPKYPLKPSAGATGSTSKSVGKSSGPAIKRSAAPAAKKNARSGNGKVSPQDLQEARALGLSETAIRRVEHNPSLLSRLVNKLTK